MDESDLGCIKKITRYSFILDQIDPTQLEGKKQIKNLL